MGVAIVGFHLVSSIRAYSPRSGPVHSEFCVLRSECYFPNPKPPTLNHYKLQNEPICDSAVIAVRKNAKRPPKELDLGSTRRPKGVEKGGALGALFLSNNYS